MPARLFEPFSAAACEEKYERSESPGVIGEAEPVDGDVEIEAVAAGAVLHRIDEPQRGVDAEQCRDS